jgi:uncharacterized protein YkuJ
MNKSNVVKIVALLNILQNDQKENKSERALQIIGHVVAEVYANKRSMHGRRQFVVGIIIVHFIIII